VLPSRLSQLIQLFARLPGVGEKTAQRYALHLASERGNSAAELGHALAELKEHVRSCQTCGNIAEVDAAGVSTCGICRDSRRDPTLLCIVAKIQDLLAVERSGAMRGRYFVLADCCPRSTVLAPTSCRSRSCSLALPRTVCGR
jgi:recombination protein RecR